MCLSKFLPVPATTEPKLILARTDFEVDKLAEQLVSGSPSLRRGLLPFLELGLDSYELLSSIVAGAAVACRQRSGGIEAFDSAVSCRRDSPSADAEEQQQGSGSLELCFFSSTALLASLAAKGVPGAAASAVAGSVKLGAFLGLGTSALPMAATLAFAMASFDFLTKHVEVGHQRLRVYDLAAGAAAAGTVSNLTFLMLVNSAVLPVLPVFPGVTLGQIFGMMSSPMMAVFFMAQMAKLRLTIATIGHISGCTTTDLRECYTYVNGACAAMAVAAVAQHPVLKWFLLFLGTGFMREGICELNHRLPASAGRVSDENAERALVAAGFCSAAWSVTPVVEVLQFLDVVSTPLSMDILAVTDLLLVLGSTHLAMRSEEAVIKAEDHVALRELDEVLQQT